MGNKSILMSIRPQYVAQILKGNKTIEVRKKFSKDYVGWVYIYCTKGKPYLNSLEYRGLKWFWLEDKDILGVTENSKKATNGFENGLYDRLNGKVVARFWCDKVSVIQFNSCPTIPTIAYTTFLDRYYSDTDLQKASCLNGNELMWYLGTDKEQVGYAIHITKLEMFDKPKELKEFYKVGAWKVFEEQFDSSYLKREQQEIMEELEQTITKAPQSWCYIEE